MPKYLWQVTYSPSGAAGLQQEGGTARRDAITRMVESIGGTVESCHFALGGHDMFVIGNLPDDVAAAALSIRTAAAGAVHPARSRSHGSRRSRSTRQSSDRPTTARRANDDRRNSSRQQPSCTRCDGDYENA